MNFRDDSIDCHMLSLGIKKKSLKGHYTPVFEKH